MQSLLADLAERDYIWQAHLVEPVTTARMLKRLIAPAAVAERAEPRDVRDLMIQARNGWALAYDDLSGLPGWLSDALCRLATGGGFSTRELYTNDEEVIFDAERPLVVNGIEDFVTRRDLLERALLVRHPPIPDDRRRPEAEFWAAFAAAHPRLLGALLDRVAAGLGELPEVDLPGLPRMADFALFAAACERGRRAAGVSGRVRREPGWRPRAGPRCFATAGCGGRGDGRPGRVVGDGDGVARPRDPERLDAPSAGLAAFGECAGEQALAAGPKPPPGLPPGRGLRRPGVWRAIQR